MTIIKGNAGGLIFRAEISGSSMYRFSVGHDSTYDLISSDTRHHIGRLTGYAFSSAIKTRLNQRPDGHSTGKPSLFVYLNGPFVNGAMDSTYSAGAIGVFAWDSGKSTEALYSNAKVWTF